MIPLAKRAGQAFTPAMKLLPKDLGGRLCGSQPRPPKASDFGSPLSAGLKTCPAQSLCTAEGGCATKNNLKGGRLGRPLVYRLQPLFRLCGLLRSRGSLVGRGIAVRRARIGAGGHRPVGLDRRGLTARRVIALAGHGDAIDNLAISRVRLRDAHGRLLFLAGRNRSGKLDGRIGHVDVNAAARKQRLSLQLVLDRGLQRSRITGSGALGHAAGRGILIACRQAARARGARAGRGRSAR